MYKMIETATRFLKKIIPAPVARPFLPLYHRTIALISALWYKFPARRLTVIGVTGTKGKSSITEMLFVILSDAGKKTALTSTIRFAIGDISEQNRFKMTTPGRGFIQTFMSRALAAHCTHIIVELTSESVLQYRHTFLALDGLLVTNIQREHIERHGSFEKYVSAKRDIVHALEHSPKKERVLVANEDVPETKAFLSANVSRAIGFSVRELEKYTPNENGSSFVYKQTLVKLHLLGRFNALNALAAIKMCEAFGVPVAEAARALGTLVRIPGHVEQIDGGQNFSVVVDYAHTPDSLSALYSAFPNRRKICVLGNTGGGRDTSKRPLMGSIADAECDEVILTTEDPYDEDPRDIAEEMTRDMKRKPHIIIDRRRAIHYAVSRAHKGDAVLISGKGAGPFIMSSGGSRIPWDDATVAREELAKLLK